MPLEVEGSSTIYFCDNFFTSLPASGIMERGTLFGGNASEGVRAGFINARVDIATQHSLNPFGSRLCFIPNN